MSTMLQRAVAEGARTERRAVHRGHGIRRAARCNRVPPAGVHKWAESPPAPETLPLPRRPALVTISRCGPQPSLSSTSFGFAAVALLATSLLATGLLGCSKNPPSEVADRLWVAEMPSGPRSRSTRSC